MNAADVQLIFLEMQLDIVASSVTQTELSLRRSATAITQIASALDLPMLASVVPLGTVEPELVPELSSIVPLTRSTMSLFGDTTARERVAAHGRNVLGVCGVSSEIALFHTALEARRIGYEVHLLMDCCGGLSSRGEEGALEQMVAAGVRRSSVSSFFTSMTGDLKSKTGQAVMSALAQLWSWRNRSAGDPISRKVDALFATLRGAWREGNSKAFAAPFSPRARFVAFDGAVLIGPEKISAYHEGPFSSYLAGTELTLQSQDIRPLNETTYIVSSEGGMRKVADAGADLTGLSAQTFVVTDTGDALQIEAFQNTRLRPIDGLETAEIWKAFDSAWVAHERSR